jgi:protein-S-isoprenylcysteine O-methyltransferase Ste14
VGTAARIALVMVSSAAYLALVIWGEGGVRAYFASPPLVALAVVLSVVSVFAVFAGGNLSPGVREERGNRWVLPIFGVLGILIGVLPAVADHRDFWRLDGDGARWTGVVLFAVGCWLRIWPVFVLGHRFSGLVAIQPGHLLVTDGIYARIRNPSYLGLLVGSLGWGLAFATWVAVLLTALLIPPLVARMNAEERLLQSEFGAEYDAYRARTARLIPGIY